jgi:hypothetical protein
MFPHDFDFKDKGQLALIAIILAVLIISGLLLS